MMFDREKGLGCKADVWKSGGKKKGEWFKPEKRTGKRE